MSDPTVVPVLLWHAVGHRPDDPFAVDHAGFHRQLDLVAASGRRPLTATQYARRLRGEQPASEAAVLLTFDDGYADLVDTVVPALLARGLTATAFITSGYLGRRGMLDPAGLAALASPDVAPSLEVGAHSVSHPHLDVLDARRAAREIEESGDRVQQVVGHAVTSFAYPHGSHSRTTRELVRKAGYRTAHAVKNALSHASDDPFGVARLTVGRATTDARLADVLSGIGAPLGPRHERARTWGYRQVRRGRRLIAEGSR